MAFPPESTEQHRNRLRRNRRDYWWRHLAKRCLKRCPGSTITEADILEIYARQKGRCYWFGIHLVPSEQPRYPLSPSVDRLDHNLPYSRENAILVCFVANMGRNDNSVEVWKQFLIELKASLTVTR